MWFHTNHMSQLGSRREKVLQTNMKKNSKQRIGTEADFSD